MSESARYHRYLLVFMTSSLLFALPIALSYWILERAGETLPVYKVAARQVSAGGLYASATSQMTYQYKLSLYDIAQPGIVALGSSRTMPIRGNFFANSFLNLGGMLRDVDDLQNILDDLGKVKLPRLMIVGVDHWWFHEKYKVKKVWRRNQRSEWRVTKEALLTPFDYWFGGKATLRDLLGILTSSSQNIGLTAIIHDAGFGVDGSQYYGLLLRNGDPWKDRKFKNTLRAIENGWHHFYQGGALDKERLTTFRDFLLEAKRRGIKIITYLLPLPPTVIDAMKENGGFGWVDDFRKYYAALPGFNYDAFDVRSLGADDCEFVDGFHGGAIVHARIFMALDKKFGDQIDIGLDKEYLESGISSRAGHATFTKTLRGLSEADFLEIGCDKT